MLASRPARWYTVVTVVEIGKAETCALWTIILSDAVSLVNRFSLRFHIFSVSNKLETAFLFFPRIDIKIAPAGLCRSVNRDILLSAVTRTSLFLTFRNSETPCRNCRRPSHLADRRNHSLKRRSMKFYSAASSIFSIKIPYPLVGSFTRTCVN